MVLFFWYTDSCGSTQWCKTKITLQTCNATRFGYIIMRKCGCRGKGGMGVQPTILEVERRTVCFPLHLASAPGQTTCKFSYHTCSTSTHLMCIPNIHRLTFVSPSNWEIAHIDILLLRTCSLEYPDSAVSVHRRVSKTKILLVPSNVSATLHVPVGTSSHGRSIFVLLWTRLWLALVINLKQNWSR